MELSKIKLSLVDKLKMSFLTDENKQKFIEEKEREARRLAREEREDVDSVEDREDIAGVVTGDPERSESVSEGSVGEDVPKKKVIVVKKKTRLDDDEYGVGSSVGSEVGSEVVSGEDSESRKSGLNLFGNEDSGVVSGVVSGDNVDSDSGSGSVSDGSDDEDLFGSGSEESVGDVVVSAIDDDGEVDEYLEKTRREAELLKKAELMRKKELERLNYMEIMLNLPPGNFEVTLRYALDAGIPEWYLREEGLIQDEIDFDDLSAEVSSSFEDTVEDSVEDREDRVEDSVEEVGTEPDLFEVSDVVREVTLAESEQLEVSVSEDVDDRVVEVGDDPIEVPSDDVTDKKVQSSLLDRLKKIDANRVKREVLKVDGDQVFVKEQVTDRQGSVKSNYANYKVSSGVGLSVGQTLDGTETLERVDSSVVIDGEDYTLSAEDEVLLRDIVSLREVWIVTKDVDWVDDLENAFYGTRYRVHAVRNERDFLMATRNVDNVILITQQIPEEAQVSIVSYLKYLAEEKRSARLVSITSSLVNSPLIRHVFEELTEGSLDAYYEEFTSDLYNYSRRPMRELLKSISFDLSDDLGDSVLEFEMSEGFSGGHYEEIYIDGRDFEIDSLVDGDVELEIDLGDTFEMEIEIEGSSDISIDGDIEIDVERGN